MAVTTEYEPITHIGDGVATAIPITWQFLLADHLLVRLTDSEGAVTDQVETDDFTFVGGIDSDGLPSNGTLTMLTAPAVGESLEIVRQTPKDQQSRWPKSSAFRARTLEAALDHATLVMQELEYVSNTGFEHVGGWAVGNVFSKNNFITHDGNTYSSKSAHTAAAEHEPGVGADWADYWILTASSGDAGTDGVSGRSITAQGPWATSTAYSYTSLIADLVSNGGSSYLCIQSHTSDAASEPGIGASWQTYWMINSEKGLAGDGAGDMVAANNLSDLVSSTLARGNLGLGSAAEDDTSDFAAADHFHDGSDIDSGLVAVDFGGVGADISGYTGLLRAAGGVVTAVPLATNTEMIAGTETGLRAMSPANIKTSIENIASAGGGVPVGSILSWMSDTLPEGWLLCDGAAVSRTLYSDLFAVYSDDFGAGDGSTTFNLPDLRGEFLRGTDGGIGRDPDRASRTDRGDGTTGDNVGTKQDDQLQSHSHGYTSPNGTSGLSTNADGKGAIGASTSSSGGNETRPRNVYTHWIVFADNMPSSSGGTGSTLTAADIERIFTYRTNSSHPNLPNYTSGLDDGRITLQDDPETPADPKVMRCQFNAGTRGHLQFLRDIGGPHDDVTLKYKLRFADAAGGTIDFQRGGKLPGLAGGTAPTGGAISSDGLGFTTRFNWIEESISSPDTNLSVYMYDMDNTGTGDHLRLSSSDPTRDRVDQAPSPYSSSLDLSGDTWYDVEQRVTMNTPGVDDGRIQVWVDSVLVLDMADLQLRANSTLGVDCMLFSTFFGGGNVPEWQAAKDTWIYYGDFEITIHDTSTTITIDLES